MNVFSITEKSINFFVNIFNYNSSRESNIKRFVEQEYRPIDRSWAYYKFLKKN